MSNRKILVVLLVVVPIVVAALTFAVVRHYIPGGREGVSVTAGATSAPVAAPVATAAKPAIGKASKPETLVESLSAALSPSAPVPAETETGPAFDVVRVGPSGDAVIAGRAAPGATVELMGDGKTIDRAVADRAGNFVMTPSQLPAGNYALALRATTPNGPEALSKQTVTVAVEPGRSQETVVARQPPPKESVAAAKPPATTTVLAKPSAPKLASTAVTIDKIEAGVGGKLFVDARGAPGVTVRLFLNDSFLVASRAGADGTLKFIVDGGVRPGDYRVRLEEFDGTSNVVRSRAEASFTVPRAFAAAGASPSQTDATVVSRSVQSERPASSATPEAPASQGEAKPQPVAAAPTLPADAQARATTTGDAAKSVVVVPAIQTRIVSRGDSLWRISEATYGSGVRYPVIYHANQQLIRNPNLIYPGQIFVLPEHAQAPEQKAR